MRATFTLRMIKISALSTNKYDSKNCVLMLRSRSLMCCSSGLRFVKMLNVINFESDSQQFRGFFYLHVYYCNLKYFWFGQSRSQNANTFFAVLWAISKRCRIAIRLCIISWLSEQKHMFFFIGRYVIRVKIACTKLYSLYVSNKYKTTNVFTLYWNINSVYSLIIQI